MDAFCARDADHSIFDGFSKVVQGLIPQLPTLENMLNALISVRTSWQCSAAPRLVVRRQSTQECDATSLRELYPNSSCDLCSQLVHTPAVCWTSYT